MMNDKYIIFVLRVPHSSHAPSQPSQSPCPMYYFLILLFAKCIYKNVHLKTDVTDCIFCYFWKTSITNMWHNLHCIVMFFLSCIKDNIMVKFSPTIFPWKHFFTRDPHTEMTTIRLTMISHMTRVVLWLMKCCVHVCIVGSIKCIFGLQLPIISISFILTSITTEHFLNYILSISSLITLVTYIW